MSAEGASATGLRPPEGKGEAGIWRMRPDSELISKTFTSPYWLGPAARALVTYTKSTVSVPLRKLQADRNPDASRLTAETSTSWLDLFNFMRIFHQRTRTSALKIQVW